MQLALTSDLATMDKYKYYRAKHFDWDTIGQKNYEVYCRHNEAITSEQYLAKDSQN